jgi:hypothetical protein
MQDYYESQEKETEQFSTSVSRSNSFRVSQQHRPVPTKADVSFSELDSPSTDLLNQAGTIKADSNSRYLYVTKSGAETFNFHNYTPISHRRYVTKLESSSDKIPFHSSPISQHKSENIISPHLQDNGSFDLTTDHITSKSLNDSDLLDIYSDIGRMREKLAQAGSRRSHNF